MSIIIWIYQKLGLVGPIQQKIKLSLPKYYMLLVEIIDFNGLIDNESSAPATQVAF